MAVSGHLTDSGNSGGRTDVLWSSRPHPPTVASSAGSLPAADVRTYFLLMGLFVFLCVPLIVRGSAVPAWAAGVRV